MGRLVGVQPRIRLMRSYDETAHSYQGYTLRMEGTCGTESGEFLIAVGEAAHKKYQFRVGMKVSGASVPVENPKLEIAEFYKTSQIKVEQLSEGVIPKGPPFLELPPDLPTYRARGHRRLDVRTYESKCQTCQWGCHMPVVLIKDHWKPWLKKYRQETFCYGPKSCPVYRSGPTRKAPGRQGDSFEEENWVDEDATSHRGPDE